ncbi:MAG: hypothetical protein Q8L14_13060 [Myxococcales bacterium]|nr:hypothetical protein [Myxococcales bacterium]
MTTETKPWLLDESADPGLRELLESAEVDAPSDRQLERLTAKVAFLFDLPPGGGDGGAGGGGGGPPAPTAPVGGVTAAAGGFGVKALVAAGVVAIGGVVGVVALREPVPTPVIERPIPVAPIAVAPKVELPPEPEPVKADELPTKPPPPVKPVVKVAPTVAPVAAEPTKATPPPPPANPDEELTALDDAITAARAGRPAQALAAVDAHLAKFPQSALAQEREVIAIEALVTLGRRDDAKARLTSFRAKWPTSTHLVRLEALLP